MLEDMIHILVAGSVIFISGLMALLIGAMMFMILVASTLGGPFLLAWGFILLLVGNVQLGLLSILLGSVLWIFAAKILDIEITE